MKKLIQVLRNLIHKIGHFIDKNVVNPITKLVVFMTSKFDKSSRKIENWLSKSNTLLFISLFLAVLIFIVIDQKIILFTDNSAEVLKDQPIKVIYNEEAYVIEGLPEIVDITLIGSKTDLYIAKQSSSHDVTVDLSGLKPGTHKVNIKYNQNTGKIDYMVNPSVATVIIYQKVSETRTLSVDILNKDSLDPKLTIESINYETDKVVIKGSEQQLKKVASVKALVDVNNFVTNEVGSFTLKDVPLRAYDTEGNVVDVEIVPEKIDVDVTIASPSKELKIKVLPKGDVSFGKAIGTIELNETTVIAYGSTEALEAIGNSLTVEIDVTGLKADKTFKVELSKPVGINSLSVNNLTVGITLDEVASRDIKNVKVNRENLKEGYTVTAADEESANITVNVKGVKSVIDKIVPENIYAYVDLSDCDVGTYELYVKVEGTDPKVQYTSKTKKVKFIISKS